ncbi:dihydrolipoamide acetyltransferase family protein [Pseudomonas sp. NFX98]|uniref:dihydrolipoamide acetyltransferase family protein n=1 Tax=Pseudomonas sp. NFX98 TaxID=3399122 RepID=UPI0039FC92CD
MADILLPQLGSDMTDGTVIAWHKKEGDTVKLGDPLCTVKRSESNAVVESVAGGILSKIIVKAAERVPVNTLLAIVEASHPSVSQPATATNESAVDIGSVMDNSPDDIPHSMTRRTIARRLTESKQQVPHFYVKGTCRIDDLLELRKKINGSAEVKTSLNDFIVRAVALAMTKVPGANVSWGEKTMRQHNQVDVAVAVATPRGLVTPIVRDVANKRPVEIGSEIRALAERARTARLKPDEYQGGTVTVSNLGMYGVEEFSAIINPPQSMIFAIGAGVERVIANAGEIEIATMMSVTISADHRAIDGAVAAQLYEAFKTLIEQPHSLCATRP